MATEDKADPLFIKSELPSVYETLPTIPSTAKESHHVSPGTIRISPAVIRMPTQDKGKNKAISLSSPDYSSEVTASKRRTEVAGPSNTMPGISRPAVTLMKSEEAHVAFMDVDPQHSIPEKEVPSQTTCRRTAPQSGHTGGFRTHYAAAETHQVPGD